MENRLSSRDNRGRFMTGITSNYIRIRLSFTAQIGSMQYLTAIDYQMLCQMGMEGFVTQISLPVRSLSIR